MVAAKHKRGHGLPSGFVSRAQWAYFYAAGRRNPKMLALAHKESQKVVAQRGKKVGFHSLPARRRARKRA